MTRNTKARIAGFAYLFYIAVGLCSMSLSERATSGKGIAAKLANLAQHASDMRLSLVLSLLGCFCALVLAVTLYGITRDEDHELATLAMAFRIGEGVVGAAGLPKMLGLLSLATATVGASASDAAAAYALGGYLLTTEGAGIGAIFFAVGSTIFSYLLMRGRIVPIVLAWLGIVSSALLVVALPLELAGLIKGNWYMWMPALVFELWLALWLLIKGVPARNALGLPPKSGANS